MFDIFKRKKANVSPQTAEAIACAQRGDFEGALRHVDALIAQFPDVAMSHRFRGETLFSLERYDAALDSFERAEQLGGVGTEEIFFWRALAHANLGRTQQATEILRTYISTPEPNAALVEKCHAAIQTIGQSHGAGA